MNNNGQGDNTRAGSLGHVIRQRRLELGLSQEQLAERITIQGDYIRQSDISNLERGRVQLPRRGRLERIAVALDLSPGQLLAQSGWAKADRYLGASLLGIPGFAGVEETACRQLATGIGHWWHDDVAAVRIVTARLTHDHLDSLIDGFRSAAMWMASSNQGMSGFLLLVNRDERKVTSLGFWSSEAAMTNSVASGFLPGQLARFQEQLAAPPRIEYYEVVERVAFNTEIREGRLAQIDRAMFTADNASPAIEQFHDRLGSLHRNDPSLDRAALLVDSESGRPTAISIWEEPAREARREHDVVSPTDVMFPQLVSPAESRRFVIALEV